MAYSLSTFLKPLSQTDKNIQILDTNLIVKWIINPFLVGNVFVSNNLVKISLNSDSEIILDFRTTNEAKNAIVKLQNHIEVLKNKTPEYIDKIIEEYIQGIGITSSQGPQGFQGPTGSIVNTFTYSLPSNPNTTTSLVGVMMGLSMTITPTKSGNIMVIITGDVDNNANTRGSIMQIRYGTGTPPTNGAALTGTTLGGLVRFFQNNSNIIAPFTLNGIATGLTLNVSVWFDISLASVTSGTSRVRDISVTLLEI